MAEPLISAVDFNLYLISDRHLAAPGELIQTLQKALDGGVRAVQLREKDLTSEQLLPLAEQLRELTVCYQARLLINGHVNLALQVDADGVHLPASFRELEQVRLQLGPNKLLGVSTHNLAEIRAAETARADFVTFGPVFATPSKLPFGSPVGVKSLKDVCLKTALPVFALGGVTLESLAELLPTGICGVAVISAVLASASPDRAARQLLTSLQSGCPGD